MKMTLVFVMNTIPIDYVILMYNACKYANVHFDVSICKRTPGVLNIMQTYICYFLKLTWKKFILFYLWHIPNYKANKQWLFTWIILHLAVVRQYSTKVWNAWTTQHTKIPSSIQYIYTYHFGHWESRECHPPAWNANATRQNTYLAGVDFTLRCQNGMPA